jgi:hypothetical protein
MQFRPNEQDQSIHNRRDGGLKKGQNHTDINSEVILTFLCYLIRLLLTK